MTEQELRHLIEPHIANLARDLETPDIVRISWTCHEGIKCNDTLDPNTDDIVFLRETDDGTLDLQPSHRQCAIDAWGEDHIIPAQRYQASPTHQGWT